MDYRSIIESKYNRSNWQGLLHDIFRHKVQFWQQPQSVAVDESMAKCALYIGKITLPDGHIIAIYEVELSDSVIIERNRAGIRNLLCTNWRGMGCSGAFMFCFRQDEAVLRFSYVSESFVFTEDGSITKERTDTKRFTYLLGEGHRSRTAIKQFEDLKKSSLDLKAITKAFSVEALSDRFFKEYKKQYEDIIEFVTGKLTGQPCREIMQEFAQFPDAEKAVRDYVKKLMGRLVFIQFLQKKGWMGCSAGEAWRDGDKEFVQNLFASTPHKNTFVDDVLEPLFNDINTKRLGDIASNPNVGVGIKIPYLNGGLFEKDEYDKTRFPLPAEYMKKLLDFFASYNFTIDENDPDDAEIGVDPEMLGRIFENLLEDNKDKGAFYTPKEIVRYMCQESLIAYLETNTSIAKDKIRQFILSPEEGVVDIPINKKDKLLAALENVKICDPAIGSGAFPMGLLNELLRCREVLSGEHYDRAEIKKSIIQNNIYGVDIEKGAVDIARLRFWLSIVVDEESPLPLPNLDYKIMLGNSLIESFMGVDLSKLTYEKEYKKDKGEISLFDDEKNRLQKTVSHLLSSYYSCSDHDRKVKLQQEISETINKQLETQAYDPEILRELRTINLAENNKFFLWHTWFSDVFNRDDKEGFDIVIGNPPYIGEKGHKEIFQPVKSDIHLGQYYLGKMDYFYFFFHLAFSMLSPHGIATFITTNYYPTALGARRLRADIKDRMSIKTLFNLGELRLFENAPGQHNMISSFAKGKDGCKCQVIDVHKKGALNPIMFASIINHIDEDTTYADVAQEDLYDGEENYIRLQNSSGDNPLSSILNKIQLRNNTLGNIAEVNAGIMGGCDSITNHNMKYADADYIQCNDIRKDDGVFVLDCSYFRDSDTIQLVQNYPFYKDFYKNSDISRYCTNEATTKRLIFSSSDTSLSEQEIIKSCLSIYQPILTKIREINNEKTEYWHQLRRGTAHPHIFMCAKIVCPQRSKTNTFGYNECDWYASADVYYITNPNKDYHIKYILGLLNSKLYYVWLYHKGKRKGETLELYQKPLSEIPIKKASPDIQNSIVKIVDEIMDLKKSNQNHDTSSLERQIDAIVYKIYGLTDAEIKIIEQSI